MKLSNLELLKLLPYFMWEDETSIALANIITELLEEPINSIKLLHKWDSVDQMSEKQLLEMAYELNIDWYITDLPLERKRTIVKSAYIVHEKRGTKFAIEELVNAAFGAGQVEEWFEYGGQPYMFKVQVGATMTEKDINYFLSMVNKVKNARSHLEEVVVPRYTNHSIYTGAFANGYTTNVIIQK